jgi:ATP-dependent exoDNAse (exonuclease V) alpha subunit
MTRKRKTEKSSSQVDDFEMNDEFKRCIEAVEKTGRNLFITGVAGTGKTTLLKCIRERTKKNYVVLAPTGIAAINGQGQTIHSFFKFPPRLIRKEDIWPTHALRDILKGLELLIVDEASMMRADLMDGIDYALRVNRGEHNVPFGGVQVVLFGDLYQLPPIVRREDQSFFEEIYATPYFFSASGFQKAGFQRLELKNIYRQKKQRFQELLSRVRYKLLRTSDVVILNSRVNPEACESSTDCITLTPRNDTADRINQMRLGKLKGKEVVYRADIGGRFTDRDYPTEGVLKLKVGAQIMMVRNDPNRQWANGSVGEVVELKKDSISIKIANNVYKVSRMTWDRYEYTPDKKTGGISQDIVGFFKQFPVRLAWAVTIHKSQGLTLDKVIIDLEGGAFAHGQVYVALSRCRSFDAVLLQCPLRECDIICDERILQLDGYCPEFIEEDPTKAEQPTVKTG